MGLLSRLAETTSDHTHYAQVCLQDAAHARRTLCGDRACRILAVGLREFVASSSNPLRRLRVSRARRTLCGDARVEALLLDSTRSLPRARFRHSNGNARSRKRQAGFHAKSPKPLFAKTVRLSSTSAWPCSAFARPPLDLARPPIDFAQPPLDLAWPRRAQKSQKQQNTEIYVRALFVVES